MKALHAHHHHVSRELIAGVAILALALGVGTWYRGRTPVVPRADIPRVETRERDRAPVALPLQVYWLQEADLDIVLAPMPLQISSSTTSEAALTEAMTVLLQGPANHPEAEAIAAIPPGTELLDLQIQPEGIYLNLSGEFVGGGGSTSMVYRVAQVLYTATSLDPNAAVYLSVDGQPLDADMPLGGEGLLLDRPLGRAEFTRNYLAQPAL